MNRFLCTLLLLTAQGVYAQQEDYDSAEALADSMAPDTVKMDTTRLDTLADTTVTDSGVRNDTVFTPDSASFSADSLSADSLSADTLSDSSNTGDTLLTDSLSADTALLADSAESYTETSGDSADGADSAVGVAHSGAGKSEPPAPGGSLAGRLKAKLSTLPPVRFAERHRMQMVLLVISVGVIGATALLLVRGREKKRFLTTTRLSVMDKEVQRACRYLESNYADPDLTLERICEDLVTGPAFLQSLFERELGMSVEQFLAHVRINRATLLAQQDSSMSIEALAQHCGFSDTEQFHKQFLQINGITIEKLQDSHRYA